MTVARQFTIHTQRLDVEAMLTGYALMVVVAWAYARACRAGVHKDRELSRLRQQVDDHRRAVVEHERDEAIRQWTGWSRSVSACMARLNQGRPSTARRIRCRATAGKGAT